MAPVQTAAPKGAYQRTERPAAPPGSKSCPSKHLRIERRRAKRSSGGRLRVRIPRRPVDSLKSLSSAAFTHHPRWRETALRLGRDPDTLPLPMQSCPRRSCEAVCRTEKCWRGAPRFRSQDRLDHRDLGEVEQRRSTRWRDERGPGRRSARRRATSYRGSEPGAGLLDLGHAVPAVRLAGRLFRRDLHLDVSRVALFAPQTK